MSVLQNLPGAQLADLTSDDLIPLLNLATGQLMHVTLGRLQAAIGGGGGGAGITDGDKGAITVSGIGTVWTLNSGINVLLLGNGVVTEEEFEFLQGVTANIQGQIDDKLGAGDAGDVDAGTALAEVDELFWLESGVPKRGVVQIVRSRLFTLPVQSGLPTTGAVALDLAAIAGTRQLIAATGDITFSTTNRAAGRDGELRIAAGAADRTLAYPADWNRFGAALPTLLAAGDVLLIAYNCNGTTDASIDVTSVVSV